MNVTYTCNQCETRVNVGLPPADGAIVCPSCANQVPLPEGGLDDGRLQRCLVCPSKELFVRKNFPQQLGVAIVVLGFAISCVTWYFHLIYATFGVLFATATIDIVLYLTVGNLLECYRCQAQYRGVDGLEGFGAFDLETHEKYRQERIRLAQTGDVKNVSHSSQNG